VTKEMSTWLMASVLEVYTVLVWCQDDEQERRRVGCRIVKIGDSTLTLIQHQPGYSKSATRPRDNYQLQTPVHLSLQLQKHRQDVQATGLPYLL
jgi:hypothetical protein